MSIINLEEIELFKSLLLDPKNANYVSSIRNCIDECKLFLQKYHLNFPEFTDHSILHSFSVLKFASKLLPKEDLKNLNPEEKYILIMACVLHDIGMSVQSDSLFKFISKDRFNDFKTGRKEEDEKRILQDFIREYHHEISYQFIIHEYQTLEIIDEKFAEAIAIVAKDHRELPILDPLKSSVFHIGIKGIGTKVCLTYLSCILLIADELDIPKTKIPELIRLYYWPRNPISALEYKKHLGVLQVNFTPPYIEIEGYCNEPKIFYEILSLIEKIENKIRDSNKLIRFLPKIREKKYSLSYSGIIKAIKPQGFLPKKIKFSIDAEPIFKRFMENNLYNDSFIAIREAILNSIDICRYKKFLNSSYQPQIKCTLEPKIIIIEDNGLGMDEFIIANFFSCLGGSYYNFKGSEIPNNITAQFGIGVFSYFLLCDKFEVYTKMQGKLSLHFVVHKENNSYFYFHENEDNNNNDGTKIIFFLKPSFTSNLNLYSITSQLKEYFQYIEIPISLKHSGKEYIISCIDIDFSSQEIYQNSYNFHEIKDNFKDHIITSLYEKSENYEIGLGFHPLINFYQEPERYDFFLRESYKPINIYYKGVFLNKMEGILLNHHALIGAINILKDESLQLNRSGFVNKKFIENILIPYERKFLKEILINISRTIRKDQVEKLLRFINISQVLFTDLNDFNNLPFLRVRVKKTSFSEFSLNDLLEKYEEILYIPGDLGDVRFSKELYSNFNLPVVIPKKGIDKIKNLVFDVIIKSSNLQLEKYNDKKYFILKKGIVNELKFFEFVYNPKKYYYSHFKIYFTVIQSDCFISYFSLDSATPILIFNTNHPVSKYILKKMDYINENPQLKELYSNIVDYFNYAYFSAYRDKEFRDKLKKFYELLEMRKIITFDNFFISLKDI